MYCSADDNDANNDGDDCLRKRYPMPRSEGFEFFYAQWFGHQCAFTPLIEYQTHQANATYVDSLWPHSWFGM